MSKAREDLSKASVSINVEIGPRAENQTVSVNVPRK